MIKGGWKLKDKEVDVVLIRVVWLFNFKRIYNIFVFEEIVMEEVIFELVKVLEVKVFEVKVLEMMNGVFGESV